MQKDIENSQEEYIDQIQTEAACDYTTTPSILHHKLNALWPKQLEDDDLELLDVSLYHLFYNLNLLLQEIIPQIAEVSAEAEAATQHIRSRQMQQHKIWLWLGEIKHRLERIEPLCQIITITITHLLTAIDSHEQDIFQKSYRQRLFYQTRQEEQQHRTLTPQESTYYAQCLHMWQELNVQPHKLQAFKQLFINLPEGRDLLARIDIVLTELYQSAQLIFSALLQQHGSNSSILLQLLLDIQQRTDLLQMQIDLLLTPLYKLREQTKLFLEPR